MIILDTNVVSAMMRPLDRPTVAEWLAQQDPRELRLTAITRAEIRYGIARLPEGRRRTQLLEAASELFATSAGHPLPFDDEAADLYGDIVAGRERLGRPIGILEAQIAAIARARGAIVATRDAGGFVDTGVELVNPFEPA